MKQRNLIISESLDHEIKEEQLKCLSGICRNPGGIDSSLLNILRDEKKGYQEGDKEIILQMLPQLDLKGPFLGNVLKHAIKDPITDSKDEAFMDGIALRFASYIVKNPSLFQRFPLSIHSGSDQLGKLQALLDDGITHLSFASFLIDASLKHWAADASDAIDAEAHFYTTLAGMLSPNHIVKLFFYSYKNLDLTDFGIWRRLSHTDAAKMYCEYLQRRMIQKGRVSDVLDNIGQYIIQHINPVDEKFLRYPSVLKQIQWMKARVDTEAFEKWRSQPALARIKQYCTLRKDVGQDVEQEQRWLCKIVQDHPCIFKLTTEGELYAPGGLGYKKAKRHFRETEPRATKMKHFLRPKHPSNPYES
jgi:hypothetical protein